MAGEHIIDGEFQSDKYPWCKRGFVPLKLTDPMAWPVLWAYAEIRESVDKEFSDDLREALKLAGFVPPTKHALRDIHVDRVVQIQIDPDNRVWVNVDGLYVLRCFHAKDVEVKDMRDAT